MSATIHIIEDDDRLLLLGELLLLLLGDELIHNRLHHLDNLRVDVSRLDDGFTVMLGLYRSGLVVCHNLFNHLIDTGLIVGSHRFDVRIWIDVINADAVLCQAFVGPLWAGTMPNGTPRLSRDGRPVRQLSMLATWADHIVVPEQSCVKISRTIPFEIAALLGCAVTTGVGAVLNKAEVRPGSTVAIVGAGGVGLSLIMGARLAQAGRIIVFDLHSAKEALARRFGATDFVVSSPENVEALRAMTDGQGADYVFEAVGQVTLQQMALEMTRPGGLLVFVGMAANDDRLSLSAANLTRSEKTVCGSVFGSARTDRDFNLYAEHYEQGRLPIDQLVTRRYALDEINEAVAAMLDGMPGRGVVVFDPDPAAGDRLDSRNRAPYK